MESLYKKSTVTIPMIPLRGLWIFPEMSISFDAGREFSKKAVEIAKMKDSLVFLSTQKNSVTEEAEIDNFNDFGVVARIRQSVKLPDGNYRVLVDGINRAKIQQYTQIQEYFEVEVEEMEYLAEQNDAKLEAIKRNSMDLLKPYVQFKNDIPEEAIFVLQDIDNMSKFADILVTYINPSPKVVQTLLEELDVYTRLEQLNNILKDEIEINRYRDEINTKVKDQINKGQKEYFLREQLQIIKSELEEGGSPESLAEEYKEKIEALDIPEDSKEHLLKEVSRLDYMASASPEVNVIKTYLDNVLDIPFGQYSDDEINIEKSRKILDKDHHGLKDVKERILEFLAVRKLNSNVKGSILCLVGPPGVGKTSIVKSVAESMNREYISMRLGGLSDESEIRGHRKTYIGAMPGRIITSLQRAKTMNPVFLFDELDKISTSYRADPASAMLEVLDPNQNSEFLDRYIEIPVDLSQVMFVTTANDVSTIPSALLDRMEIIYVSGYTEVDKLSIAKKYLLPKQIKENGLKSSQLTVSDAALQIIIKNYTRESGVRNLERQIAKLCRKAAMKIVEGAKKVSVSVKNYSDFLGREKRLDDDIVKKDSVGIVTGLAWTSVGGELLQIEVNSMKGKGRVQLTGSLGDVMKESAMAAISYIKSDQNKLGIKDINFDETDIHVHVPEGATPKDGPSAGITMSTGIISALTGRKVRQDVAMTGEVTIRGRVLPIGGLKEKSLAAKRYGITNIIIPKKNEPDLEDIPKEVLTEMNFYPVSTMEEVLDIALVKGE
ncbi:ATP-dependent protease La [Helcococcus kunzii ATCC 51366]|uniref:Lon protease n=1 Tax=Helcococcus kunzii ATCC 51366 TaxID=883114 RepID=H3NL73_9FIRM|nr:endopeptidase La [Helcococcus kunzii]EHR36329.1 ATP-dependent protease La [Helcococcus kunzii ATCC 51366]MCT1796572.1 endopeptidase La [Helcococcus kunzii]MCT1989505.1 endopeptidase La [Helcococcus kunzii]